MRKVQDLSGNVYYFLTVLKRIEGTKQPQYECLCKCGNTCIRFGSNLLSGVHNSCGCWRKSTQHHLKKTGTYITWRSLRNRCNRVSNHNYKYYGGKGVTYDPRWEDFRTFIADMGMRPEGKTLDRIDSNGMYCKENCRWADIKTQANNKTFNVFIEYNGKRQTIMQWADETGLSWSCIRHRLKNQWSTEEIFNTPIGGSTRPNSGQFKKGQNHR